MKILTSDLKMALEIVKPGLSNKEIRDQFTSFAFTGGNVVTYNDEISVSHPLAGLEEDFEGAVKAEEIYKLVSKMKTEEVELTANESELILTSGKITAGFALEPEVRLPIKDEVSERGKWKKLPETFMENLNFGSMCCAKDMSSPVLICVHVNSNGFIESSDELRIIHCEVAESFPFKTFLLPKSMVSTLIRVSPIKISEGNGWMHFKTELGTIVSCRTYSDNFPNTSKHLSIGKDVITINFPKELIEAIDRAMVIAKRDNLNEEEVEITIGNKSITIKSESEISWFQEKIKNKYDGEPITFSIIPYLLKGILSKTEICYLNGKILQFSSNNWIYITMTK